jgi:peroxiredoxin
MANAAKMAPDWHTSEWLNSEQECSLEALRGQVVVLEAFQMLCPACVQHSLPQARRVHQYFHQLGVQVIGLHSVFEHHAAQSETALRAFVQENRLGFPIAVDAHAQQGDLPLTMAAYSMQGTPTCVLIDRLGRRRAQHFGVVADLQLAAEITSLLLENHSI